MAVDPARQFRPINIAVLTVSDTRDMASDTSGALLEERIKAAGHRLAARAVVKDDVPTISDKLNSWIDDGLADAIVTTGGTGLTGRDVTPEALDRIKDKDIPGFGELFRWISYQSIGSSTVQSRACAVLARGVYIFALPGSNGAVKDGWDGILAEQLDSRNRPCNFVELMPRLREV
ncbi:MULTISPECIES: molybdenum cofactor biosynthesis protein B [unclassified Novosphingobium]|uniref:molybdenum cofactor biosynthesis protein B n=1 Tax=unclassified Novosphingobium TaxID=2644732 RepID=UPI000EC78342|nr:MULTISPECIES: molybdenum cofactor biosynthesis protein B [unclassified Novosphingobium]HCF24990.1 molybdenum cofactor biosynthesis protein B [Novosphingobium sp.]HQV03635.1 molybdenum cofactor biosynthesis protein B [Novosphingobium sp.]